ncbi:MAG TPA: radical SAM protein [Caldisericia bacterium]|nr:radical SAM protein [Caldisericia bacterium]HQL66308.1 radical SAM protein [Caldisericia bacterium]
MNRIMGIKGVCGSDFRLFISSYHLHFGEEKPISGYNGSGAIFFTNCTLKCLYCQNYEISHLGEGYEISIEDLAKIMLLLQHSNAHNINLVSPTHYLPQILLSLSIAVENGLKIPIVYNTSGYEKVEILKFLEGIVDIYLPDAKYMDKDLALKLSKAKDYPEINEKCLLEMKRQVKDYKFDDRGIILKGVIIRHLILPNNVENSKKVLKMIYDKFGNDILISLMTQYHPCFKAISDSKIGRDINKKEFDEVFKCFNELGFDKSLTQPF